jgi:hypothetical protein
MMTPTFFAGACIVVAAALAYSTTQTHLVFRGLGPACAAANCSAADPGTAPGVQLGTSTPAVRGARATASNGAPGHARPGGTSVHAGGRAGSAPGPAPGPGANPVTGGLSADNASRAYPAHAQVVISYRTIRSSPGAFLGAMTITNRTRSAIPNWLLWMRYRAARMHRVWGARWYPVGSRAPGAGVVAPGRGQPVLAPGATVRFLFWASGHAGPPDGCFFNTSLARFGRPGR